MKKYGGWKKKPFIKRGKSIFTGLGLISYPKNRNKIKN